jgi:probable FeS assembly SUF system protein SufT
MSRFEEVVLTRDVDAIQIPVGDKITLPGGTSVIITQTLGGTYTVQTNIGYLARIDGKDADALGKQVTQPDTAGAEKKVVADIPADELEKTVWDELRTVFDPEIPVNVVDLGLVYGVKIGPHMDGGSKVDVTMTLTAPGCGMGDVLKMDAEYKLKHLAGVREAVVEMVVEPPWNQSMMSEAARLELGMW